MALPHATDHALSFLINLDSFYLILKSYLQYIKNSTSLKIS